MSEGKINVLLAEDSPVTRMFLVHVLESDPRIRVVGAVGDGSAAVDFVVKNKPDVVLMDLYMPVLDGFEATRRIMEQQPLPIVICSAVVDPREMDITFRSLEAGAVACIEKPTGSGHADFETTAANLLQTVKLMSEVSVVRRTRKLWPAPVQVAYSSKWQNTRRDIKLIAIGASTGGPPVLQTILASLPKYFPAPILLVQHIARGFVDGMAEWLNRTTSLQIQIASYGTVPLPGRVYLAPDDFHMGVGAGGWIVLTREEPEHHVRPAVSFLFRSLAAAYGPGALGVLLTGMGSDGAAELKLLKDTGATTIAQDRESSLVHGMPGVAIALGGATHVLSADKIADALVALVSNRNGMPTN
ncbi:MAG: chemotaxis-specific protein-glutamate methyltransferase CheB [Gammaproteobacteria bacterium]|nr:chemotaxis-specific protein-glutamate methyltransferase CheB [Gammaproteobacteria bacterium]